MKRLNPKTGKPFIRGDRRDDGYYFVQYKTSRIKKDGTYQENWSKNKIATPKEKVVVEGKKSINEFTGEHFKRGDQRADGYYFLRYQTHMTKSDGFYPEVWIKNSPLAADNKHGIKRNNPKTGKPFVMGQIREDGKVFLNYVTSHIRSDGTFTEAWCSKDDYEERLFKMRHANQRLYTKYDKNNPKHIRNKNPRTGNEWKRGEYDPDTDLYFYHYVPLVHKDTLVSRERWLKLEKFIPMYIRGNIQKIREKCRKKKIPYDINYDYLISIFPKDRICPALGIKMEFGGAYDERQNSPSIDRLYPHKGYVKGNIRFVSYLANAIMNEADPDEIIKVGKWLESEGVSKRNMKRKSPK